MAKSKTPDNEVRSGTEPEVKEKKKSSKTKATSTKGKKKGPKSKAFEENIIRDSETAKKRGANGGKKSGQVRRDKMNAREAAQYILELASKGNLKSNLQELGADDTKQTNMVALQARLFTLAMSGNLEAYRELMKIAGYEPEENRKERESVASDRRRDMEVEAKVNALGGGVEGADIAINSTDEEGHNDVVIYMPRMLDEKDCEPDDEDKEDTDVEEENESSGE